MFFFLMDKMLRDSGLAFENPENLKKKITTGAQNLETDSNKSNFADSGASV